STLRYGHWEEFAQKLDKVLALFIQIYQPAFFERIGLRYVNAFSRKRLGLQEELWDDLINSPFIGVLSEPDVDEKLTTKCALDVELSLGEQRHLKLHAGPGLLGDGKKDPEPKFILDGDFSVMDKEIPAQRIAGDLSILHDYAVRLFNAAVTQELHEAMGPVPFE
ncbi:MAG: TIGR04255 family protein, partial [Oscillospiraceae bacterium]|nr:TIGR04255 family protein [Oscillospiraceae bacterium]